MKHEDLPKRWKTKIEAYLASKGKTNRNKLLCDDFSINEIVEIKFEDDSYAEFRFPLVIKAPEYNEIGIFTEHCGYHIFNLMGVDITIKTFD
ncbi:MAG: hypothetical protein L3J09_12720 [Flavobacteriaceae bacterium]|nr:hypothetical protein [Flavobacteriaceae bacterium]